MEVLCVARIKFVTLVIMDVFLLLADILVSEQHLPFLLWHLLWVVLIEYQCLLS